MKTRSDPLVELQSVDAKNIEELLSETSGVIAKLIAKLTPLS